jgi:hypothetical protein
MVPAPAGAEPATFDEALNEGVAALGAEEYRRGLRLLKQAGSMRDDPRVDYYLGYAHEKLGMCAEASHRYTVAATAPGGSEKLRTTAEQARRGLRERCPATTEVEQRAAPSGDRFGWKIMGWSALSLGALTFLALPVKTTVERDALAQSHPYFMQRYGCEMEFGDVTNDSCDEAALKDDPAYSAYQDRVAQAQRTTRIAVVTGAGLAVLGVGTLLTLAATAPSRVALTTNGRSVTATLVVRF